MKVLVTGGGGFLGQALCKALCARGDEVQSFSRGHYPALDALGVKQIQGDLQALDAVRAAVQGCDAVIHNAAKAGAWGSYESYYQANVVGTHNVIDACKHAGIRKLVYTSTPSVTHRANHPVAGGTAEDVPYGVHFKAPYATTKQIAEVEVLAANGPDLATVALRPRLIWGVGDTQILPRLVDRARAGKLAIVGDGENLVDSTYVDNAAQAHLNALDHLDVGSACAGKAYFISNGEPRPMHTLLNDLLGAAGVAPVTRHIPFSVAYAIGAVSEWLWPVLRRPGEPPMTRFLAEQLSTTHWYSMAPATRDFGYRPQVSTEEGLARVRIAWNATR